MSIRFWIGFGFVFVISLLACVMFALHREWTGYIAAILAVMCYFTGYMATPSTRCSVSRPTSEAIEDGDAQ